MTAAEMPKIPPFPLTHYRYPRDRLRHWAALQGTRVFSPTEMLVGAGLLGARSAIRDLVREGELTRLGHNKLQVAKLLPIVDTHELHRERQQKRDALELLEREIDQITKPPYRPGNEHVIVRDHWQELWATMNIWWQGCLYDAPWVTKTVFTDVPLRRRPDASCNPTYEFWPRADIEAFKGPPRYSYAEVPWEARRGTRQTAEMLGRAQNSEDVAAIWLAAFAFDNGGGRNHLKESWRGRGHAMVRSLEWILRHYFKTRDHLYWWHHAMTEVRPANSLRLSGDSIVPKDLRDCIGVAALDAILSHALYVPVRFVPTDSAEENGA